MGCSLSSKSDAKRLAEERSSNIDEQIKRDRSMFAKQVKLLNLGAAGSGKSTVTKQLKLLYREGFSEEERRGYKIAVHANVMHSMLTIVKVLEVLSIDYEDPERMEDANKISLCDQDDIDLSTETEVVEALKRLWKDSGVQCYFHRSKEYEVNKSRNKSANYFLNDLDRICSKNYIPTVQDVVRIQVPTTGISEFSFEHRNLIFSLLNINGARGERRKWIHHFQDVTAIIFCVSLSSYDNCEDYYDTNRMQENLELFDVICNHSFFTNTPVILFLNKKDIFEEEIEQTPLSGCFAEYSGQNTYEETSMYIRSKFEDVYMKNKQRQFHSYFTCAIDTANISFVFDVVSDVITSSMLS